MVGRVLEVVKAVDNTAFSVEITRNHIEKLGIAFLEFTPQRIRDKIGILYDARRPGIHE